MKEPISLKDRQKRLKSLDEFERPPWPKLDFGERPGVSMAVVIVGFALGACIGMVYLLS